jgi:hypothetical protein
MHLTVAERQLIEIIRDRPQHKGSHAWHDVLTPRLR